MNRLRRRLLGTALAVATSLACFSSAPLGAAAAEDYPTHPVTLVVPAAPGGINDLAGRLIAEGLTKELGQQFIVDNKGGASGNIGIRTVARAEPDGYTLMMINDNHAVNPSVFKNIPYDSVKDFAPIGFVGSAPMALSANARLPVRTVQDLIELARQQPGKISYASVGIGSASHLAGELFAAKAGVRMLHVPFRGGAPAINDLVAGHVDTMFVTAVVGGQHMKTGALTPLALAASARFETLPEVPTMAEAGYPLEAAYWFGLAAPAGTPPAVLARLESALTQVLAMPDLRKRMTEMGAVVTPLGSRQFGDYIRTEMDKWADVIVQNSIRFD
jgi:tripartite-type tricarboxylate transporter receptor subunit TctC